MKLVPSLKKSNENPNLHHKKEASKLDLCGASAEGRGQRLHSEKYLTCAITVEPEHYCGIWVCVCVGVCWDAEAKCSGLGKPGTAYGLNTNSCSEKIMLCALQPVVQVCGVRQSPPLGVPHLN